MDYGDSPKCYIAAVNSVGRQLKRLRVHYGLTQVELAYRSGIEQARISKYERGTQQPNSESQKALARGFELPVGTLVDHLQGVHDLTSGTESGASRSGGTSHAQARVRQLEAALREEETAIARIRDLATELLDLTARRAESLAAARAVAHPGRGRGGTG